MKKERGFTLIELLVVISIISLLSSIVLSSLSNARDKANTAKALTDARLIVQAIIYAQGETSNTLLKIAPSSNDMGGATKCNLVWNSNNCLNIFHTVLQEIASNTNGVYSNLPNIKSDPWGNAYIFDANQGEGECSNQTQDSFSIAGRTIPNWPSIPLSPSCQ